MKPSHIILIPTCDNCRHPVYKCDFIYCSHGGKFNINPKDNEPEITCIKFANPPEHYHKECYEKMTRYRY